MSDEKEFVDGLIVKAPHEKAPNFVKCNISIKRKDLGNWLRGKDDDWINIQVKEGKTSGKWYAEVDTWKPNKEKQEAKQSAPADDFDSDMDSIPF